MIRIPQSPPGLLWPIGVGGVGFAAGFFGPMVLVPESNLGPIIGLFVSGPAGLVLGAVLGLICRLTGVPERVQWFALAGTCALVLLVLGVALQPAPALRGHVIELQVVRERSLSSQADAVIAYWRDYVARVTWTQARPDWEAQMRRDLQTASGSVVDALVVRQRDVLENRKLWNRGTQVATPWVTRNEAVTYYLPANAGSLAPGSKSTYFVANDSLAPVEPPSEWPPREVIDFLALSVLEPVPVQYELR
jgi:hypothetical protein